MTVFIEVTGLQRIIAKSDENSMLLYRIHERFYP